MQPTLRAARYRFPRMLQTIAIACVLALACASAPGPEAHPTAPARDTRIHGYAAFSPEAPEPSVMGKVVELTAAPDGEGKRWTIVVEDGAAHRRTYMVRLPATLALPIAVNDSLTTAAGFVGGGPTAVGWIHIADDRARLILAINQVPAGWTAVRGKRLDRTTGASYDEFKYAVVVGAPGGARVELVEQPWRSFELDGQRLVGRGAAIWRHLHGPAPSEYVGESIDFALVRAP